MLDGPAVGSSIRQKGVRYDLEGTMNHLPSGYKRSTRTSVELQGEGKVASATCLPLPSGDNQ